MAYTIREYLKTQILESIQKSRILRRLGCVIQNEGVPEEEIRSYLENSLLLPAENNLVTTLSSVNSFFRNHSSVPQD